MYVCSVGKVYPHLLLLVNTALASDTLTIQDRARRELLGLTGVAVSIGMQTPLEPQYHERAVHIIFQHELHEP